MMDCLFRALLRLLPLFRAAGLVGEEVRHGGATTSLRRRAE